MTGYLNANNIHIFDFSNFSQPLTEQIRANAQRIAEENDIEIKFIRKRRAFPKDDQSKCLHCYFYFIDKELGLCYLRVPAWTPFRLQFCMNGHNLIAHKLQKKEITYRMH